MVQSQNLGTECWNFQTIIGSLYAVFFMCYCKKKKRITCWLCENHIDICLFDVVTWNI